MAFYWAWEDVSPVRRLRDQYDDLLEELDYEIKKMEGKINNIHSEIRAFHKTLNSYSYANGSMAELYYQKIADSEASYRTILSSCEDALSTIRSKRRIAQQIRNDLQHYYQIEQRKDKKFSLWEVGL